MATPDSVSKFLRQLLSATKIEASSLATAPTSQGVYVLWFVGPPKACLKVGIAGPRNGLGLRGRLRLHFGGNTNNSVLARHLASDVTSRWSVRHDFTKRVERQAFLAERCYFQTSVVQDISRRDLEMLEAALIERLRPAYVGRVGSASRKMNNPGQSPIASGGAERDHQAPRAKRGSQPARVGGPVTAKGKTKLDDPEWSRLLPWLTRLRSDRRGSVNEPSGEVLRGLVEDLYNARIVYSFDWPEWQAEAERLYRDKKALQVASLADLRRLLTTHVRKDRFCEGHLDAMLRTGHLLAILEQVAHRVNKASPTDDPTSGCTRQPLEKGERPRVSRSRLTAVVSQRRNK